MNHNSWEWAIDIHSASPELREINSSLRARTSAPPEENQEVDASTPWISKVAHMADFKQRFNPLLNHLLHQNSPPPHFERWTASPQPHRRRVPLELHTISSKRSWTRLSRNEIRRERNWSDRPTNPRTPTLSSKRNTTMSCVRGLLQGPIWLLARGDSTTTLPNLKLGRSQGVPHQGGKGA
jgi:hypothetical protein